MRLALVVATCALFGCGARTDLATGESSSGSVSAVCAETGDEVTGTISFPLRGACDCGSHNEQGEDLHFHLILLSAEPFPTDGTACSGPVATPAISARYGHAAALGYPSSLQPNPEPAIGRHPVGQPESGTVPPPLEANFSAPPDLVECGDENGSVTFTSIDDGGAKGCFDLMFVCAPNGGTAVELKGAFDAPRCGDVPIGGE